MRKNKKFKLSFFFLLLFIFVFGANFTLAAEFRVPEINYPLLPFPGVNPPQVFIKKINEGKIPKEQAFPLYVKYFYHLILTISGLIALGVIIYGGFCYLISAGAPAKMFAARELISGGVCGLLLLLSSYLILITINPQLAILHLPELEEAVFKPEIPTPTKPELSTAIQVPTGRIIEDIIKDQGSFAKAKEAANEAKKAAGDLNTLAIALKNKTDDCTCGKSSCGPPPDCGGTGCPGAYCNTKAINQKIAEIKLTIEKIGTEPPQIIDRYTPSTGLCSIANLAEYWTPEALGGFWYPRIVEDASIICHYESAGHPYEISKTGDYGLFQINRKTYEEHLREEGYIYLGKKDFVRDFNELLDDRLEDNLNIKVAIYIYRYRWGCWCRKRVKGECVPWSTADEAGLGDCAEDKYRK